MYCRQCGKEIKDDSVFCEYCGTKVVDITGLDDENANVSYSSDSMSNKVKTTINNKSIGNKNKNLPFLAVISSVTVVLIICIVIGITNPSNKNDAADSTEITENGQNNESTTEMIKDNDQTDDSAEQITNCQTADYLR